MVGVLIPFLYATSSRTQSLRPVRIPSNENIRWWLPFCFSITKRQEPLVCPIFSNTYKSGWSLRCRTCTTLLFVLFPFNKGKYYFSCKQLLKLKLQEDVMTECSSYSWNIYYTSRKQGTLFCILQIQVNDRAEYPPCATDSWCFG